MAKTETTDTRLLERHLVVALDRIQRGKFEDAQRNIEYARSRLAAVVGIWPPASFADTGEEGNFS
jgi:hypothetical protein